MSFDPASFLYVDEEVKCKTKVQHRKSCPHSSRLHSIHHIDIVDVEIVGSSKNPVVRVRIDHDDETAETISLDEVAQETSWISETIDELDPFPASFTLEVSSPGMARPLRRAKDFERFAGEEIQLQTTAAEGRRKFTGKLLGIEGTTISIQTEDEV